MTTGEIDVRMQLTALTEERDSENSSRKTGINPPIMKKMKKAM